MALPNPLNPINPAGAEALLGKFAASDAKHDFKTEFLNIFKNKSFTDIGTAGSRPTDYFDEWGTLSNVFSHTDSDKKNSNYIFKGTGTAGDLFKENVLNTSPYSIFTQAGSSGISLNTSLGARYTYKVRSMLFSTGDTIGLANSDILLEFLGGINNNIYIQQDASFISFSDFFLSDKNVSSGEGTRKHFYYLGSREGQNDAAGKTNSDSAVVKKTVDKKVVVSILPDEGNETIVYPKYTTDQNSDVKQNFQSIYNLSISPMKEIKGVKTVSLNFYDKEQINATQKGKAENAKGNLKERLTNFFKNFSITQNKQSYFTALQQKRSGDWLQVLSTYDLTRYKDAEKGRRGILITHDFICAAYAIAMGVDVIITIQKGTEKWVVFFENELYLRPQTKKILFERYTHIRTNINTDTISNEINAYKDQKLAEIPKFIQRIDAVELAVFNRASATKKLQDDATNYIKELLKAYFRYTIVLMICPDEKTLRKKFDLSIVEKNSLEKILDTWKDVGAEVDNEDRKVFSEYEKVVSNIYNIKDTLDVFKIPIGGLSIMNVAKILTLRFSTKSKDIEQLTNFLDYFSPFSVEENLRDPEKPTIFLNRFRFPTGTNGQKKNDYGVFSIYLNKLDKPMKDSLYDKILACKASFTSAVAATPADDRTKGKKQELDKNFGLFIDEIKLYFKDATAPSFEAGTTGELLTEINGIQVPGPDSLAATTKIRDEIARMVDEGAGATNYSVISGGSGKGSAAAHPTAARAAARSAVAAAAAAAEEQRKLDEAAADAPYALIQDKSSVVLSTPFTIYLIWLLTKRNTYIISQRLNIVPYMSVGAATTGVALGSYFFKTAISSLLPSYLPTVLTDIAESIVFTGISAAGGAIISTIYSNFASIPVISPYSLTTDTYLTLSNDSFIKQMRLIEDALKAQEETRGRELRFAAATARGTAGGGPLDSFDLPYSSWASLFYHMDTMRTQLDDIHNPEHGFDYAYFARYSQFLIAMEKSIDSTIRFFTIKRPKKGGQYGSNTVVITDEPRVKSKPTQLVLRLKGGPVDLYEVPIGYSALFTSFGDYCDLILSNLLPRVYFDSVWDELKPMLTKAFTGSEGPDTKWIGLVAETCNDNYLNTSADTNLNELFNPNDLFLRYFLITTCHTLEQMPILDMSISGKESLELQLNESIQRLLTKINLVEKNIIVHMYKKKVNDDSINFETINDVGFLMEKNLLLKSSEPEPEPSEGGKRRVRHVKKRTYGKTKKYGRRMRLKSQRRTYKERR
jgi:hypothetical protein